MNKAGVRALLEASRGAWHATSTDDAVVDLWVGTLAAGGLGALTVSEAIAQLVLMAAGASGEYEKPILTPGAFIAFINSFGIPSVDAAWANTCRSIRNYPGREGNTLTALHPVEVQAVIAAGGIDLIGLKGSYCYSHRLEDIERKYRDGFERARKRWLAGDREIGKPQDFTWKLADGTQGEAKTIASPRPPTALPPPPPSADYDQDDES